MAGLCFDMLITSQCCSSYGANLLPMHSFDESFVCLLAAHGVMHAVIFHIHVLDHSQAD